MAGQRLSLGWFGVLLAVYGKLTYTGFEQSGSTWPPRTPPAPPESEARIVPDGLAVIRRAAELQGRSIGEFLVAAALKDAHQTIEKAQIIRLSVEDQAPLCRSAAEPTGIGARDEVRA
jgi:uncharacterized protein (DUF1778 family)